MSIRNRLLVTMIALTSTAVIVCSLLAYHSARQSLRSAAIRQLAGIRRSRADTVESLFERVRHDTDSLSDDRMFVEGVKQFSNAYAALNVTPDPKRHANVVHFYEDSFLPEVQKYMSLPKPNANYLPHTEVGYLLQDRYVVGKSNTDTLSETDVGETSDWYSRVHSKYDAPIRKLVKQF